jgi:hypothetical protein
LAAVGAVEGRRFAMRSLPLLPFRLEVGVRWTARVLTVLLVGLFLVPFVVNSIYDVVHGFYEGGLPHAFWVKGIDPIQMVFFWTACIGLVVAWRWPVIGGALALGGMLLLFAVEFAVRGGLPGGLTLYLMPLPGLLFLADNFISRRRATR